MTYPFLYTVELCGDTYNEYKNYTCYGVTFASDWSEAADNLKSQYDPDLMSLRLFCLEDSKVLELPKELVFSLENDPYTTFNYPIEEREENKCLMNSAASAES